MVKISEVENNNTDTIENIINYRINSGVAEMVKAADC